MQKKKIFYSLIFAIVAINLFLTAFKGRAVFAVSDKFIIEPNTIVDMGIASNGRSTADEVLNPGDVKQYDFTIANVSDLEMTNIVLTSSDFQTEHDHDHDGDINDRVVLSSSNITITTSEGGSTLSSLSSGSITSSILVEISVPNDFVAPETGLTLSGNISVSVDQGHSAILPVFVAVLPLGAGTGSLADFSNDGIVGNIDTLFLAHHYNVCLGGENWHYRFDIIHSNELLVGGDSCINWRDLQLLAKCYGWSSFDPYCNNARAEGSVDISPNEPFVNDDLIANATVDLIGYSQPSADKYKFVWKNSAGIEIETIGNDLSSMVLADQTSEHEVWLVEFYARIKDNIFGSAYFWQKLDVDQVVIGEVALEPPYFTVYNQLNPYLPESDNKDISNLDEYGIYILELETLQFDVFADNPAGGSESGFVMKAEYVDDSGDIILDEFGVPVEIDNITFSFEPGEYSSSMLFFPDLDQSGVYRIKITVSNSSDDSLKDEFVLNITVDNTNQQPLFEVVDAQTVPEGAELVLNIKAKDNDGDHVFIVIDESNSELPDTFNYELISPDPDVPDGNGYYNYTFKWIPSNSDGTNDYIIRFLADDGSGMPPSSMDVDVLVQDVNNAPYLSRIERALPIPTVTINDPSDEESVECWIGELCQIILSVDDDDGDAVSVSINGAQPSGSAFDSATNTFEWNPDYDSENTTLVFELIDDHADGENIIVYYDLSITINKSPRFSEFWQNEPEPGSYKQLFDPDVVSVDINVPANQNIIIDLETQGDSTESYTITCLENGTGCSNFSFLSDSKIRLETQLASEESRILVFEIEQDNDPSLSDELTLTLGESEHIRVNFGSVYSVGNIDNLSATYKIEAGGMINAHSEQTTGLDCSPGGGDEGSDLCRFIAAEYEQYHFPTEVGEIDEYLIYANQGAVLDIGGMMYGKFAPVENVDCGSIGCELSSYCDVDYGGKVYVFNGDVHLSNDCVIPVGIPGDNASRTFIIRGDLTIESDIKYGSIGLSTPESNRIPSAAFIIIGNDTVVGNVIVEESVSDVAGSFLLLNGGVFKTIETQNAFELKGMVMAGGFNLNRLADGSGVAEVFIDDSERLNLNTPPGLENWSDILPDNSIIIGR